MEGYIKSEIKDFLIHRIKECRILVLGDVMLDRYFYGEVTRISPEAPVPVNSIFRKKDMLGGAANVANNLAQIGCQVQLVGVVANDHHGRILKEHIAKIGIDYNGLIYGRDKTTTKIRILGGHQQMLRLDFEEISPIEDAIKQQVESQVIASINRGIDAVILSDYHKGVCIESICQSVIMKAHEAEIPVFVDPKGKDWKRYYGADYITPNVREIGDAIGYPIGNDDTSLRMAAKKIKQTYQIKKVIATRSEKGMSLFLERKEVHIPTVAQEVFDVSGAGDTVISVFASGIAGGLQDYYSAQMANFAAGIEVGKVGTYAVKRKDILNCI